MPHAARPVAVISFPTKQACPAANAADLYNPTQSTTAQPGRLEGDPTAGTCASNSTVQLASGRTSTCAFAQTYGQGSHTYTGVILQVHGCLW